MQATWRPGCASLVSAQPGSGLVYHRLPGSWRCWAGPQGSSKGGFGKTTRREDSDDDEGTGPRSPRRRKLRGDRAVPLPADEARAAMQSAALQSAVDAAGRPILSQEDEEFKQRLQALKAQTQSLRPPSAGKSDTAQSDVAAFDVDLPSTNIYANPPSIADTLMTQLNSDVSDPSLKTAQFGPNQVGVAVGAVIFGLVFVLVAGGELLPNDRYKGVRSAQQPPDSLQQGIISSRIDSLKQELQASPNDPEILEELALSYAQLLQYDKAAAQLDLLTQRQPKNPDAWRLLGETALLGGQARRAATALERANSLRPEDLQIVTGLVDAYIATGQQPQAVSLLLQLRAKAPPVSALGVTATETRVDAAPAAPAAADVSAGATSAMDASSGTTTTTSDASEQVASDAGARSSDVPDSPSSSSSKTDPSSSSGSGSSSRSSAASKTRSSSQALRPLEPVSVELLLAKTYSQWRGHESDAVTTYDALIARFPEDFRGYLAKGVLLRDKGRRADAERMFLQARFWAPENRQRFVTQTVETQPEVDLPSND